MFFLKKCEFEDDFKMGDRVMVLADFLDVEVGRMGKIDRIYPGGVMVEWDPDHCHEVDAGCLVKCSCECPDCKPWRPLMDGFGRDELEYLAVGTACHPKVVVNFL